MYYIVNIAIWWIATPTLSGIANNLPRNVGVAILMPQLLV